MYSNCVGGYYKIIGECIRKRQKGIKKRTEYVVVLYFIDNTKVIETKQTISPRLGIPVNVEFKMTICSNGHKFILMPDLEKTLKNVSDFEGKVISEEIK